MCRAPSHATDVGLTCGTLQQRHVVDAAGVEDRESLVQADPAPDHAHRAIDHLGRPWEEFDDVIAHSVTSYSDQPIRTVSITLTPEQAAYWSDVRKYGCQGAGAIAVEKAKAAKAAAKAAKKGAKSAPAAQSVKVAPAPVHIRRAETEQIQDVAAINALKPKSQADLMDVLVRLRGWLAYWEVKDVAISVEGNSVVCRVKSQDNWNRVVAVWAKDISVVRV